MPGSSRLQHFALVAVGRITSLGVVVRPPTSSGATPSYARLALRRIVEAAEGTKLEPSLAHAPISVFDLRFEPSSFLFINIVG